MVDLARPMTPLRAVVLCLVLSAAASTLGLAAEARLVLKGRISLPRNSPLYTEDNVNFYGTHLYLLESEMLLMRAEAPLKQPRPSGLKIKAERIPDTSIIRVTVQSSDDSVSRLFLASLIDEFLKYKREQKKRAFAEAIARVDAALKAASRETASDLESLKAQLAMASLLDTEPDFEVMPDK